MQPYFFPYLGYFQLIDAVDQFVFYDDVNFIKNGWINRNRLAGANLWHYFTVPLAGASSNLLIREVRFAADDWRWRRKMFARMSTDYRKAPFREVGLELLERTLTQDTDRISELAKKSILSVMSCLGITREVANSGVRYDNRDLSGTDRVIDICRIEAAQSYINLPGGRELYDRGKFLEAGIDLRFVEPNLLLYPQGEAPFQPGLSVLDALMWCGPEGTKKLLRGYSLTS